MVLRVWVSSIGEPGKPREGVTWTGRRTWLGRSRRGSLCDWLWFSFGGCEPVALSEELGAFDADLRDAPVEPARHVPVDLAHHDH